MKKSERGFFMAMLILFLIGIMLVVSGNLYQNASPFLMTLGLVIVIIVLLAIIYRRIAY